MRLQLIVSAGLIALLFFLGGASFAQNASFEVGGDLEAGDGLAQGQVLTTDSAYQKRDLKATELKTFFSYYNQDGIHSAVTGGIGTEKMSVYQANVQSRISRGRNEFDINGGVDLISSASTDRIDFVLSSASRKDAHVSLEGGWGRWSENSNSLASVNYLFSFESDYLSNGLAIGWLAENRDQSQNFELQLSAFLDDLRWGRLNRNANFSPRTLIYPFELRDTEWSEEYLRQSYNLGLVYRRDLSQRARAQFSVGFTFQAGLLSTPFHRVYFAESDTVMVERFPDSRIRVPIAASINYRVFRFGIWKSQYRFYADDFGIISHAVEMEFPMQLNSKMRLYPFGRVYLQSASDYFAPFDEHSIESEFFTSDYDLSEFQSCKVGLGFGFYPYKYLRRSGNWFFDSILLRYAYYWRSDGLKAHILSSVFELKSEEWKQK